jgi:hypothetical protein
LDDATSREYVPLAVTAPEPQVTEPTIAVTVVPAVAAAPDSVAVPYTRIGGEGAVAGRAVAVAWAAPVLTVAATVAAAVAAGEAEGDGEGDCA